MHEKARGMLALSQRQVLKKIVGLGNRARISHQ
ncbi:Uncharacterised protein [Vibrio cholerae]|nr:Uncharacterised protein [Vibrio cholerae]